MKVRISSVLSRCLLDLDVDVGVAKDDVWVWGGQVDFYFSDLKLYLRLKMAEFITIIEILFVNRKLMADIPKQKNNQV